MTLSCNPSPENFQEVSGTALQPPPTLRFGEIVATIHLNLQPTMNTSTRRILLLALLSSSSAIAADIQLPMIASGAHDTIRASLPQSARASSEKPASISKLPADLTAPTFGQFKFGPKEAPMTIAFAFDDPPGKPGRLFMDANGNGDLTDDPAPEWTMSDKERNGKAYRYGEGHVMLYLAKGDESSKVRVKLYRYVGSEPSMRGDLQYYPDYARIGKVELDGKTYGAILHDEYASGDYRHFGTTIKFDLNGDGRFNFGAESFRTADPFKVGEQAYEVTGVNANGSSFQLVKSTRPVPERKVSTPPVAAVQPGKAAPAFEATTITGQKISFPASYKGKLVLLDFWATWCGPCIGELPNLIKAYETHHAKGLEVLGISLDSEKTKDKLPESLKTKNMTWPQVCDGKGWDADISRLYGVRAIPAAFLVDGTTGIVLATQGLRGEQLTKTIEDALSGKITSKNPQATTPRTSNNSSPTPLSLSNASLTGSKWTGGANFWIEFRADGDYREFWRGGEYPGTWKVLSEKEVSVSRKDGWDYVFTPTADGALLRVWQPKPRQDQQENLVFRSMAKTGTASDLTSRNHMFEIMRLAATDRDGALKTVLDGMQSDPLKNPWAMEITMLFKSDERRASSLPGEEKKQLFAQCRDYILRARALTEEALKKHPGDSSLTHGLGVLDDALARASLELGDTTKAKELAQKQLAANTDTTNWNYGNIIHDANSTLGRAALRDGDKKLAAGFLHKAGATPGSPQLNSFGPDWTLAREMIEAGETQAVLDYFDLVEKFWVNRKSSASSAAKLADRRQQKLDQWRAEVRAGKVPDFMP